MNIALLVQTLEELSNKQGLELNAADYKNGQSLDFDKLLSDLPEEINGINITSGLKNFIK